MNARELAIQSIYDVIFSVNAKTNLYTRLYLCDRMYDFQMDTQHFDEFCEKTLEDIHPEDREAFIAFSKKAHVCSQLQQKDSISMECRLQWKGYGYHWRELIFKRIADYENPDSYENFLYMVRDIHERKTKEEEVLRENQELITQLKINNQVLFE